MTDRFDAQLRQHLLETANERAAEGQVADLIDRVAVTRQRPGFLARWSLDPGRIGQLPAAPVRYGVIAIALVLAAMAGAMLGGGGRSGPTTVFEGTWLATDPADGSGMTLAVGPGTTPDLYFEDAYASGDACVDDKVKRFVARGTGSIEGDRLDVDWPNGGGCGLRLVGVSEGPYLYDPATDTLVDDLGITWFRPIGDGPAETPTTTARPATDAPSPVANDATFRSTIHGMSIDYPSGWTVVPATEPWTGQADPFDGPTADALVPPNLDGRLVLLITSQAYGDLTADEWRSLNLNRICVEGWSTDDWAVDGYDNIAFGCEKATGVLVSTDDRGYLIVFLDRGEGARSDGYDEAWFRAVVDTVSLRPAEAVAGGPEPTPLCTEFRGPGTYTATRDGGTTVTVDVPATENSPWHGDPYDFALYRAPCLSGGPHLDVTRLYGVPADACKPGDDLTLASDYDVAVATLSAQAGYPPVALSDATVGGYAATVFTVTAAPDVATTCTNGILTVAEGVIELGPGERITVYLVDTGNVPATLLLQGVDDDSLPEFEAVIASMAIAPAE